MRRRSPLIPKTIDQQATASTAIDCRYGSAQSERCPAGSIQTSSRSRSSHRLSISPAATRPPQPSRELPDQSANQCHGKRQGRQRADSQIGEQADPVGRSKPGCQAQATLPIAPPPRSYPVSTARTDCPCARSHRIPRSALASRQWKAEMPTCESHAGAARFGLTQAAQSVSTSREPVPATDQRGPPMPTTPRAKLKVATRPWLHRARSTTGRDRDEPETSTHRAGCHQTQQKSQHSEVGARDRGNVRRSRTEKRVTRLVGQRAIITGHESTQQCAGVARCCLHQKIRQVGSKP